MPLSKVKTNSITDNAVTTDQMADTAVHGRRNLIINGAMEVQQYGSSGTKTGGNSYGGYLSADRWAGYYNNTTFATQTPVRLDGNLLTPLRVSHSNSSNTPLYVYQNIEDGMKKYAGQTLTISLYARGSSAMTLNGDNSIRAVTAGNTSTDSRVGDYTDIDITTSWQRYTRTITLDASYTAGNDHLFILFAVSSQPSSAWLEITGVQVEVSDTATPFEHARSYGEVLAACQRYYQKHSSYKWLYAISTSSSGGYRRCTEFLPVEMRATPTLTFTVNGSFSDSGTQYLSTNQIGIYINGASDSNAVRTNSATELDAEL